MKAILILDEMPKSCNECQLKVLDADLYYTTYACQNVDCETDDILKTTKYEMNCPLKPYMLEGRCNMSISVEKFIRDLELNTDIVVICSTFNNTINIMSYKECERIYLGYELIDFNKEDDGLIYLEISNNNYHDLIRRLNEINRCNN